MNNKQRVILLFLILFFGFLFFYSVRIGFQGKLSDISLDIRDIKKSLTIEPDLRIQNYFLKVKFFKDENSEFSVNTFVNGNRIESFKKKEKSDYVKLHFIINKDLLKPSGNIIRFEFEKKLPTSIFINIANYYKRLTHDLVIFPSYIDMPRHRGWVVFVLISLVRF